MIATGELRQNFEQFWREAAAQLGNSQSLTERGSGKCEALIRTYLHWILVLTSVALISKILYIIVRMWNKY